MKAMWNERFSTPDYVYGEAPNSFLVEHIAKLAKCRNVLLLAEGEGRNAVYLARQGFKVTAIDFSEAGREKCLHLAKKHNVTVNYQVADLADYTFPIQTYDAIIGIFAHTPKEIRQSVHAQIPSALTPHGICLIKGYTAAQLSLGTGGPKDPEMLLSAEILRKELQGLEVLHCEEKRVMLEEGQLHNGESAVVEYISCKR